jgi:uncharacterized protein CbrC (UPF0167 family)
MTTSYESLPRFLYHPDPVATHVIIARKSECPVCRKRTGYAYEGPFYSVHEVENICPWCIANGAAASTFDGYFIYTHDFEQVLDAAKTDELQHRTPGYFFGSEYYWPVHCGDYCGILRKVKWRDIADLENELFEDLDRLQVEDGIDRQAKRDALTGTALWAYLFRCLHCGRFRLVGSYE